MESPDKSDKCVYAELVKEASEIIKPAFTIDDLYNFVKKVSGSLPCGETKTTKDQICPLLKTCEFYQKTSFFELTDFVEKPKLNKQSTPLCECGRPLVNKLVCSDRNCQQTSW